ncbi:MAG: hypothetical protein QXG14_00610 [Candidatus Hadarchaeales archaeon]
MAVVKVQDRQKEKLERLLAEHLKRGERITIQEALGMMIEHALKCEKFAEEFEELPPLEKDPAWIALQEPIKTGIKDLSENIDQYIYGG